MAPLFIFCCISQDNGKEILNIEYRILNIERVGLEGLAYSELRGRGTERSGIWAIASASSHQARHTLSKEAQRNFNVQKHSIGDKRNIEYRILNIECRTGITALEPAVGDPLGCIARRWRLLTLRSGQVRPKKETGLEWLTYCLCRARKKSDQRSEVREWLSLRENLYTERL